MSSTQAKRGVVTVTFPSGGSIGAKFEYKGDLQTRDIALIRGKVLREYRHWKRDKAKESTNARKTSK